jgi:PAS domain S-box-containing protein
MKNSDIKNSPAVNETIFKLLYENSGEAILLTQPDGSIYAANPEACRIFNMTEDQICNLGRNGILDPSDPNLNVALETRRKTGRFKGELKLLKKDGTIFPGEVTNTVFRLDTGEERSSMIIRDITAQKNMEEELRSSRKLLESLNLHLHEVWENEKAQIALNIHDDLGQKLTALNMDIVWLKGRIGVQSQTVRIKLNEMSSDIIETIERLKEISAFLRPSILFDLGLIPAIISHLERFQKQSGISCKFVHEPEEFEIDERLALILYRIVQESLTNIARHSNAKNVEVNLKKKKSRFELLIKDDGIGISKEKINSFSSMGLAGMRERVRLVNGNLKIYGEKEPGTKILVVIPFLKQ